MLGEVKSPLFSVKPYQASKLDRALAHPRSSAASWPPHADPRAPRLVTAHGVLRAHVSRPRSRPRMRWPMRVAPRSSIESRRRSDSSQRSTWSASSRSTTPTTCASSTSGPMPRKTTPLVVAQVRVRRVARALREHRDRRAGRGRLVDRAPGGGQHEVGLDHLGGHAAHVVGDLDAGGEVLVGARRGRRRRGSRRPEAALQQARAARAEAAGVGAAEADQHALAACWRISFGGRCRNSVRSVA